KRLPLLSGARHVIVVAHPDFPVFAFLVDARSDAKSEQIIRQTAGMGFVGQCTEKPHRVVSPPVRGRSSPCMGQRLGYLHPPVFARGTGLTPVLSLRCSSAWDVRRRGCAVSVAAMVHPKKSCE